MSHRSKRGLNMSSEIAARIAGERKVIRAMCEAAIEAGFQLSYFDGEEWPVKNSRNLSDIMAETHGTDCAAIRVSRANGDRIGTFDIVYGNSPSEVIADYSYYSSREKMIMDSLYGVAEQADYLACYAMPKKREFTTQMLDLDLATD